MTTQEIIQKLFMPISRERVEKAKGAAIRSKIDWALVLADMTDEQRQAVYDAESR